ncbi:hypothetical protein N9K75_01200 [bacterium]|nr:hypothetical protein [bacterium]
MTRYSKTSSGKYNIMGKIYEHLVGSRASVWHKNAYKTTGGLTKKNLLKNKNGRIVSSKKHASASREKRLLKHGYGTRKGKFGAVKLGSSKRRSRRARRGGTTKYSLSPASLMGDNENLQLEAGMAGGRRHRRKGGMTNYALTPAPVSGMADDSVSTDGLQLEAGMAGGRRHRRHRKGGMTALTPASVSGMADNSMSTDSLQLEAGMAGGRRHRRRGSRSSRRGSKGKKV